MERLPVLLDTEFSAGGSFHGYVGRTTAAFAVTRGLAHTLVYANGAFRRLVHADDSPLLGFPIGESFAMRDATGLTPLLDRAFRSGVVSRNRRVGPVEGTAFPLSCTIWPDVNPSGVTEHLMVELREATQSEVTLGLQREVAERLLLSALRESDAAEAAEQSRQGAAFVASESRRLAESLDEEVTLSAMKRMSLPIVGAWCIVDTLDDDDTMHRLAIIHPDPEKHAALKGLEGRWTPRIDDGFGLPAALREPALSIIASNTEGVFAAAADDPATLEVLQSLGAGPLLTVPLLIRDRLVGAVTFVGARADRQFSDADVLMARDLANRSAMALDRARLYGEAVTLRARAEAANEAKSAFLGMMSHELRTPLNAIGGYVDLIDLGIHGPVTEEQRVDLGRIRSNQRYLMGLISDLLNLTKVDSGHLEVLNADIIVREILEAGVALVEPLIAQRHIVYGGITCDSDIVACGDPEKVIQILVNLLSNAIKFTGLGGTIALECGVFESVAYMRVKDTGIGIAHDKLEAIFEPFVQVKGTAGPEGGIGLGLAISRSLARAMHGDLVVDSTLGAGSVFTLTLPLSRPGNGSRARATPAAPLRSVAPDGHGLA